MAFKEFQPKSQNENKGIYFLYQCLNPKIHYTYQLH